MTKFNQGYAAILPIVIIMILIVLGAGSFIYTHPGFSLYNLYNLGSNPSASTSPQNISIDKSEFVSGEILVAFQTGTTLSEAKAIFAKYAVTDYRNITGDSDTLSSIDVFVAMVAPGLENEIVTKLKGETAVKSATLNYSGAK